MAKDPKINDAVANAQALDANDPDLMTKLNEIALKVAEAQGKVPRQSTNLKIADDPMDELGCEGCQ